MTDGERKILAQLERMTRSLERLEVKLCGPRPTPAPPTPAEFAHMRKLYRADRVRSRAMAEGSGEYPSSSTTLERFRARAE